MAFAFCILTSGQTLAQTIGHSHEPYQDPENLKSNWYSSSYDHSRTRFLERVRELKTLYPHSVESQFNVPSVLDSRLYVDMALIKNDKAMPTRVVVLLTGVHGGEGYTGAAQMQQFMSENASELVKQGVGVILVHGLNPYGMKYFKRTTENNVDLNRNFYLIAESFQVKNSAYEEITTWLNEAVPVRVFSFSQFSILPKIIWYMVKNSKDRLTQATAGGQHQYPKGIFFGGFHREPQIDFLFTRLKEWTADAKDILLYDLHTGYGKAGHLHLYGSSELPGHHMQSTKKIFQDFAIDWGGDKNFYRTTGDSISFFSHMWRDRNFAGMCLEMGTRNSQGMWGSFLSLQSIRLENQGYLYGYKSEGDFQKVQSLKVNTFYPQNEEWRKQALKQAQEIFQKSLNIFKML